MNSSSSSLSSSRCYTCPQRLLSCSRAHQPRWRARRCASASSDIDKEVYLNASHQPEYFVGPVAVANIPGKGRGLVAREPLSAGQLLLVVPPLALVEGDFGEIPDHGELLEVITASGATFSAWQADWIKTLSTTTTADDSSSTSATSSTSNVPSNTASSSSNSSHDLMSSTEVPCVPSFLPPKGQSAWNGIGAPSSGAASDAAVAAVAGGEHGAVGLGGARIPFEGLGMDEEQLWAAIVLNCYGEAFPDLPATQCAAAPLNSQLGLWGPFSLLNHACCPNAVNYTLRDCMVVRAAAPTPVGEEVVINYLGRGALRPRSQRQTELQACYGFTCNCRRCQTEEAWAELATNSGIKLESLLDQIHENIGNQYEPQLQQLLAAAAAAGQEGVSGQSNNQQQGVCEEDQVAQQLLQLADDMRQQWQQVQSAFPNNLCAGTNSNNMGADSSRVAGHGITSNGAASQGIKTAGNGALSVTDAQQQQAWALASAFDLLALLHEACDAAGQPDQGVLDAMLDVAELVCAGSDLHLFQALRWTSTVQQSSNKELNNCDNDGRAFSRLAHALRVRYGQQVVDDQKLLQRMVDATNEAAAMVCF